MSTLRHLPNPGAYARAWRALKSLPANTLVRDPFEGFVAIRPAGELLVQMRRALDRRINIRGGRPEANRPVDIDLQRDARDLTAITRDRVRIYQFRTALVHSRFSHLLASRHD